MLRKKTVIKRIDAILDMKTVRRLIGRKVTLAILAATLCLVGIVSTFSTLAGHPIGWEELSAQGKSYKDSTGLDIATNAARSGLAAGTLCASELAIGTYQYMQDGDADTFQQHMGTVATGNLIAAGGMKLGNAKSQQSSLRNCFIAGTLVSRYSPDNIEQKELVPIEQIKFGDRVWAFNRATDSWEPRTVLDTYRRGYVGDFVAVNIGSDVINATGGHPFWVLQGEDLESRPLCECLPDSDQKMTPQGRWVYARDLRIDDVVRSRSFGTLKVTGLDVTQTETAVYNFLVDELHNYAVGQDEVLVHNTNAAGVGDKSTTSSVPGTYRPSNPLPLDKYGNKIPSSNTPHTQLGTRHGGKGDYTQAREFGENGQLVRDIDFTDHGYPSKHPNPHQHRWEPNETGGTWRRNTHAEPLD